MDNKEMQIEISKIVKSSKAELNRHILKSVKEQISSTVSYSMHEKIGEIVKEYFDNEISPQMYKMLKRNKALIIDQMDEAFISVGAGLAKALKAKAMDTFKNPTSWKAEKVLKELF